MDPMDRADSKMNESQLYQPHFGLHPGRLCVEDLEGPIPSVGGIKSDWLPFKIKECGKIVGITVDNSKEGWSHLLAFAQERENQNIQASVRRELNRLASSINCDKGGGSSEARFRKSRGKKTI
ncbi:hypothetical protein MRB53_035245 [Persea americana]|uniref:Uncharacterized protein n=1 Tax=Persea americana TaxID=3435 RepID=A0ACC2K4G4_PERAE|nr:hypothetical protein MRB53_035245 [Persea americana]